MRCVITIPILGKLLTVYAQTTQREYRAPYFTSDASLMEDEYIVLLHSNYTLPDHFKTIGMDLEHATNVSQFSRLDFINGYSAKLPYHTVHDFIRFDPGVKSVEDNSEIQLIHPVKSTETLNRSSADTTYQGINKRWEKHVYTGQYWHKVMATCGFRREPLPDYGDVDILSNAGEGAVVYVLDTGIQLTHDTFNGRATNFKNQDTTPYVPGDAYPMKDVHGHGTHVAGIVSQMAPYAHYVNVKVLNDEGHGRVIDIINALKDVTAEHVMYKNDPPSWWRGSVINMSLSGPTFPSFQKAVEAAFSAGIPIAAAAGNENAVASDAPCIYGAHVICVAAANRGYSKWVSSDTVGSNYGTNVAIIAPGEHIYSADAQEGWDHNEVTMSGTSMASPHVAGIMAIYVGYENLSTSAATVYSRLRSNQIPNIIRGFDDGQTHNLFVNSGINNPNKTDSVPYDGAPEEQVDSAAAVSGKTSGVVTVTITTRSDTFAIQATPTSDYEGDISISNDTTSTSPSSGPTPPPGNKLVPTCASDGIEFPQPPASKAIDTFCSNKDYWNITIVPSVSYGTGKTSGGLSKAPGVSDHFDLDGNNKMWLGLMFTNNGDCQGWFEFAVGANDQEKLNNCKLHFGTVLDGCQTDTITNKNGGVLRDVCAEYVVTTRINGIDPFDSNNWTPNQGDFKCENTNTTAIGGSSSPLAGTCTCWYSGYPGLTDVFKMPSSHDCKDTNKADLLNN